MDKVQEIYEWFKAHENNKIECIGNYGVLKINGVLENHTIGLKENKILLINNKDVLWSDITNTEIITDKELTGYDMQLKNEAMLFSFNIIE